MRQPTENDEAADGCFRVFVAGWYFVFGSALLLGMGMFGVRSVFTIENGEDLFTKGLFLLVLLLPLLLWWQRRRK